MNSHVIVNCETCGSRKNGVFCELSDEHLKGLSATKTTNLYKPHQIIFYEGNKPFGVYCVIGGKIKIYKMDDQGHQKIVRLAGAGSILGYRSLLADDIYTATAETIEEATICFIDKKAFLHILGTHPATAMNVMRGLAEDLGSAEKQVMDVVHKNVRERLAELFIVFKTRFGRKEKAGIKLDISLSREEMAEMIGTTPESVIRLITDFKQEKLIAVKGREITLLDMDGLHEAASLVD